MIATEIQTEMNAVPHPHKHFYDLPVEPHRRANLPWTRLKSRLSTAIICTFWGRRKPVIVTMLTLNKSGRAYIITQEGLRGFLVNRHDNLNSWIFELQMSRDFIKDVIARMTKTELNKLTAELQQCNAHQATEKSLR